MSVRRSGEVVNNIFSMESEASRQCEKLNLSNIENRYETTPLLVMTEINTHMVNHFSERAEESYI